MIRYVTFNYNLFYPLVFESDAIFSPFYHSRKKLRCYNAFQLTFLKLLLKRNATAQHQVIIKTESFSCSFTSRSADQGFFVKIDVHVFLLLHLTLDLWQCFRYETKSPTEVVYRTGIYIYNLNVYIVGFDKTRNIFTTPHVWRIFWNKYEIKIS